MVERIDHPIPIKTLSDDTNKKECSISRSSPTFSMASSGRTEEVLSPESKDKEVFVRGYVRANGTVVAPYYRSKPMRHQHTIKSDVFTLPPAKKDEDKEMEKSAQLFSKLEMNDAPPSLSLQDGAGAEQDDDESFDAISLDELLAIPMTTAAELRSYVQLLDPRQLCPTAFKVTTNFDDNVILFCRKASKEPNVRKPKELETLLLQAGKTFSIIQCDPPKHVPRSSVSMGENVIYKQTDLSATIGFRVYDGFQRLCLTSNFHGQLVSGAQLNVGDLLCRVLSDDADAFATLLMPPKDLDYRPYRKYQFMDTKLLSAFRTNVQRIEVVLVNGKNYRFKLQSFEAYHTIALPRKTKKGKDDEDKEKEENGEECMAAVYSFEDHFTQPGHSGAAVLYCPKGHEHAYIVGHLQGTDYADGVNSGTGTGIIICFAHVQQKYKLTQ
jgi:hypothetical protein